MTYALTASQVQILVDVNDGLFLHDADQWEASQGDIQTLMGLGLVKMSDEGDLVLSDNGPAVVSLAQAQNFDVVPDGGQMLHVFNA